MTSIARRYVSEPLLRMLQAGSLAPSDVQKAIAGQAAKYGYPVLRPGHPYIRRVRSATGLNVTDIAWRYGRLLVSVEQINDRRIHWFYREFKGSYCSFRCPLELPETVLVVLRGRLLAVVTDAIRPLANVTIAGVDEGYASDGWLNLKLAPNWIPF